MASQRSAPSFLLEVDGLKIVVSRKRVKNVNFRIGSDGVARMSVPERMSHERVVEMARSRAPWFAEHMRRRDERRSAMPQDWETGETLSVWGEEVVLRVERGVDELGCRLAGGTLVLGVPHGSTREGRASLVMRWLGEQLSARVGELLPDCERRVGRRATSITFRRMKTRWGSCTPRTGRIRINLALAECPPDCLEMVLVHELCHLVEPSHSARFHALMDLHCPSWRVSQRWLDEHPPEVW